MAQKPTLAEDKKEVIKLETEFYISLLALGNDKKNHKAKIDSLEKELELYRRALNETEARESEILAKVERNHGLEKDSLSTVYQFIGLEFVRLAK